MGKGRPRATQQLAQAPGGRGHGPQAGLSPDTAVSAGGLCTWPGPIPSLWENHCQKLSLTVLGWEALRGQLALLGDSQLTGPPAGCCSQFSAGLGVGGGGGNKLWLPATTSAWWRGGWGPKSRFIVSPVPWAPSQPRRIGAMTRINVFGSGLSH